MAEILPWVEVGDLLEATGARNLSHSGNEYTFSCFSENHSHGDATPSAGMNSTTSLWQCRSPACGLKGNAADYLAALKGYTRSEAMRVLSERYGGPEISAEPGALEAEVERIRKSYERFEEPTRIMLTEDEYLDRFAVHRPENENLRMLPGPMEYMRQRGFSARTLNEWQIGFDDLGDRVTIPVYDEEGTLVGIKGRAWRVDQFPRYISIGDAMGRDPRYGFHTYHKSQYVFGLHRVREGETLVVVEGELNAVALAQMGIVAVAVAGADFSDRQRELIVSRCDDAVIFFDPDHAGNSGARWIAAGLHHYMPIRIVEDAMGDAADALDATKPVTESDVRRWISEAVPLLRSSLISYVPSYLAEN